MTSGITPIQLTEISIVIDFQPTVTFIKTNLGVQKMDALIPIKYKTLMLPYFKASLTSEMNKYNTSEPHTNQNPSNLSNNLETKDLERW